MLGPAVAGECYSLLWAGLSATAFFNATRNPILGMVILHLSHIPTPVADSSRLAEGSRSVNKAVDALQLVVRFIFIIPGLDVAVAEKKIS